MSPKQTSQNFKYPPNSPSRPQKDDQDTPSNKIIKFTADHVKVDGLPNVIFDGQLGQSENLTASPDYERLYQAMQLDNFDGMDEDRVRKKYACQALSEDTAVMSSNQVGFSRDLYVNGVEYIIRGLPRNLPATEKQRIHILLGKLQPIPRDRVEEEPYPFIIFLFRQLGLLLKHISPHVQSFLLRLVEFEQHHNVARGFLETGMGLAERGVNIAMRLGVRDALVNFGTALGRGVGESYRVYREDGR